MRKVYIHYEQQPEFTKVVKTAGTVQQAIIAFVDAYNARHVANQLDAQQLLAVDAARKPIAPQHELARAVEDGADIFLLPALPSGQLGAAAARPVAQSLPASATARPELLALQDKAAALSVREASDRATSTSSSARLPATSSSNKSAPAASSQAPALAPVLLKQLLEQAQAAASGGNCREAVEIYRYVLASCPSNWDAAVGLATLWMAASRAEKAVEVAEAALQHSGGSVQAHKLVARCLEAAGQPRQAAAHYQAALQRCGDDATALEAVPSAGRSGGAPSSQGKALQVALARALYAVGSQQHREVATEIVVLLLRSDSSLPEAWQLYAEMAADKGLVEEAVQVALSVFAGQPQQEEPKALLARCLQQPGGLPALLQLLEPLDAVAQAQALAALATSCKDRSAIGAATALLARCVELHPSNASYALNLVHVLELEQDYSRALEVGCAYCLAAQAQPLPPLGGAVRWAEVSALLKGLPAQGSITSLAWRGCQPWQPPPPQVQQRAAAASRRPPGSPPGPPGIDDADHSDSLSSPPGVAVYTGNAPSCSGSPSPAAGQPRVAYSAEDLDSLALLFTLVKILYVGGAVAAASQLCQLVEPARQASKQELHTTLIRNEAAYYGCVLQLVREHPPPAYPAAGGAAIASAAAEPAAVPAAAAAAPAAAPKAAPAAAADEADTPACKPPEMAASDAGRTELPAAVERCPLLQPLYLCGDSHCLSAAWYHVTLRGASRLLQPLLVTGCKIWHLRQAGSFYPKAQFNSAMAQLPDGAQVVLLLGEIDCREGLLLAVSKCKYDSLEEAQAALADIYVDLLLRLIADRRFELFVHPPAPVLDPTRPVVKSFTGTLKAKVTAASTRRQAAGRLHYLDFGERLLAPGGDALHPELQFDGTHMAPCYVKHLDAALSGVA